jgi:hypothetical protein
MFYIQELSFLLMLTTERMGKSPAALYRHLWPNTILSGDRLPELRQAVRRIAYVAWNAVGNGGFEPDGYAFLHGTARWMDCGARIVEITPELVKAVLRTDIRWIEDATGNDFRLPSVLFVMPKGTLRSTVRGDCSYLLASISMPTDRSDFSPVGCMNIGQPCIWLLSTASSSYEQQVPELICDELDLRDQSRLEATILRPVPERMIAPEGLVALNDADFRFVCLHLGFKLLVLLNLYWSRLERLKFIYDDSGIHYRQRCPPEFFWRDFNLNSGAVRSWNRGTLIFHQGEIGVYGVDADWILPSPGSGLAEEPEMPVDPEPKSAMSPKPIPRFWRGLRDLFGTE